MLFPTYEFLCFFLICFSIGIFLKTKVTPYKYFLFFTSIIFYSLWNFSLFTLLATNILINYLILQDTVRSRHKKIFLIIGLAINLGYLGYFKYYNFFVDSLFQLLNALKLQFSFPVLQIIVPLGVSFYIFRIISHLIDCYRNQLEIPSLLDYAVYVTYFPQITSGPISRAKEFYIQLNSPEKYDYQIENVIVLIIAGLFKKYTLSSFLFNFTQLPFSLPEQYSSFDLILAALAYSCLIYVDFSGYSDLANAISSLLGFKPIQNFNMPYSAVNLQEFWRKWHISLSEWLRDYLYIALGGNKNGKLRKYLNLLLTMMIGGFWHGAGLNFIIWGTLHGIGLIVWNIWRDVYKFIQSQQIKVETPDYNPYAITLNFQNETSSQKFLRYLLFYIKLYFPLIVSRLLTFSFVTLCWIFFNTPNFENSIQFLQVMFNFNSGVAVVKFNVWQLYIVFMIVLLMNLYGNIVSNILIKIMFKQHTITKTLFASSLLYVVFRLGPNTVAPFIYFNF
ncbi:MAG: MBOAT family O-acyltransferase [Cyanobacteria bacterium P01_D01_bin.50]